MYFPSHFGRAFFVALIFKKTIIARKANLKKPLFIAFLGIYLKQSRENHAKSETSYRNKKSLKIFVKMLDKHKV